MMDEKSFSKKFDVTVCKDRESEAWFARVNYSACGPITPKQARNLSKYLLEAAKYAEKLNKRR